MGIESLKEGWVVMGFSDGTMQTVHTTFNRQELEALGVRQKEGHCFDLDRLQYVPFRQDAVNADFYAEKPSYSSEVLNFASRFI